MTVALDPQVEAVLAELAEGAGDGPLTVDAVRLGHERVTGMLAGAPEPVAWVEERAAPGPAGDVRVRLYRPERDVALPAVLYLHGGGWVVGSLDSFDPTCRALANASGAMIASVDYRRAPEDRFPAAVEDGWAALRWLRDEADDLGADPARLAVAGDSAGGNLAAVVALRARDAGSPALRAQVLIYPATDAALDTPSYEEFDGDAYGLSREQMAWYWGQYLGEADPADPAASPLRAPDLAGVAPAIVLTAAADVLRDDGERYAARLREAGVPVTERRVDGMVHGFIRWLARADAARREIAWLGEQLRAALA